VKQLPNQWGRRRGHDRYLYPDNLTRSACRQQIKRIVNDPLPPGVTESELLDACVGPDLDNITATAVLSDLRKTCLYLHHDGVRYCFKKDPNVTKLVEDAVSEIERDEAGLRSAVKERLTKRLADHPGAHVWPEKSSAIPDKEHRFLVAYLPLEVASKPKAEQHQIAIDLLSKCGDRPRIYRNGVALANPDRNQVSALRQAVAALLAVERVEKQKTKLKLSQDQVEQLRRTKENNWSTRDAFGPSRRASGTCQLDQLFSFVRLKERRATENTAEESAFRLLYDAVWLPKVEGGSLGIESIEVGGRPLKATGVHERIMELLTAVSPPKVHGTVTPRNLKDRIRLGDTPGGEALKPGGSVSDVVDAFYSFLGLPRLSSAEAIRKAIVQGVNQGLFAYSSGTAPTLGPDGRYQVAPATIAFQKPIAEDEVDFETGFLIAPAAVPAPPPAVVPGGDGPEPEPETGDGGPVVVPPGDGPTGGGGPGPQPQIKPTTFHYCFAATRDQVSSAFSAITNLADEADDRKVVIEIRATKQAGFDPAWLRNAVQEPLDEANVEPR
jgi:hypothetical protein